MASRRCNVTPMIILRMIACAISVRRLKRAVPRQMSAMVYRSKKSDETTHLLRYENDARFDGRRVLLRNRQLR